MEKRYYNPLIEGYTGKKGSKPPEKIKSFISGVIKPTDNYKREQEKSINKNKK